MKNIRKLVIGAGAFALSMAIVSMSANVPVAAKGKSDTIKPNPPSVAKGKSATIPVELPTVDKGKSATIPVELPTVDAPATERGIKDVGVKSCNGCGMTGREAAPPPVDDGAAPNSAERSTGGSVKSIPGVPFQKPIGGHKRVKTPKTGNTSLLLPVVGGLAGLSAVIAVAASGGDDKPASP